jgi:uncharacterized membrane protein (UPF0127 family)
VNVLLNTGTGSVIARSVSRAKSAWQRAIGLMGRTKLDPDEGLWLEPCSAVHTIGMRIPVDIVLLNASHRVVAIVPNACPMCPIISHPGTTVVIELASGSAKRSAIAIGHQLRLQG